ncbi:hypothetical protein ELH91_00925 [Rhizobium leguminosarum]|uniref:M12 family metallopeptidase n=1 Tax=Rhizobium leguminosarum TaxID=384 RepID=UPI00102F5F98|nr:M12 family metallopeptidase [Rhizobium leguminosarum]TAY15435.1 hypothetical protein ELH91_00925 [Rhizobium leguminosarum]
MKLIILVFAILFSSVNLSRGGAAVREGMSIEELTGQKDPPFNQNGEYFFGDIIIKKRTISALGALNFSRWTSGRVVFDFDTALTLRQQQTFRDACNAWTALTPLTCAQRNGERNYIQVGTHTGDHCGGKYTSCSELGMQGGRQDLWIYSDHWNGFTTVIQHEIGHAIGLLHEHQRPDRDHFVLILESNIQAGAESQFSISGYNLSATTDYDFDSIMHYDNCDFSIFENCLSGTDNMQTIQARACHRDRVGGNSITPLDRLAVSRAYSPEFLALFAFERNASCQKLDYNVPQWERACSEFCPEPPTKSWKKIVTAYYRSCTFIPAGQALAMCADLKRQYIDSWTDSDPLSCPFGATRNEIWSKCGCLQVTLNSTCSNYSKRVSDTDVGAKRSMKWRQGRSLYFLDIAGELSREGAITDELSSALYDFVLQSYLEPRFETKLARVRAGFYSYAKWKRTIHQEYRMDLAFFNKIAERHGLRAINP